MFSQPDKPLGVTGIARRDLKKLLLDSVNDKYLEEECEPVYSEWDPQQECFIAVGEFVLVPAGPRER